MFNSKNATIFPGSESAGLLIPFFLPSLCTGARGRGVRPRKDTEQVPQSGDERRHNPCAPQPAIIPYFLVDGQFWQPASKFEVVYRASRTRQVHRQLNQSLQSPMHRVVYLADQHQFGVLAIERQVAGLVANLHIAGGREQQTNLYSFGPSGQANFRVHLLTQ